VWGLVVGVALELRRRFRGPWDRAATVVAAAAEFSGLGRGTIGVRGWP